MFTKIATLAFVTSVLCSGSASSQVKLDPDRINPWYKDASGQIDPCKEGLPLPETFHGSDGAAFRASLDQEIASCRQRIRDREESRLRSLEQASRRRAEERAAAAEHKAYLERRHLTAVTVLDLQAYGKDMVGGDVAVTGFIKVFGEDYVIIYTSPDDINGVPLNLSTATPASRKFIFSHCSSLSSECKLEVEGTVAFDGHVSVDVN